MNTYICMCVYVCVCLCVCMFICLSAVCAPWHLRGGQRRIVPFTLCIHGVGLGSSSLVVSTAEPSLWPLLGFSK